MNNVIKMSIVAVILALGLILSSSILSKFLVSIRHEKAITVKGYAETEVVSDIGKFTCTCRVRGTTLKESYEKLQKDRTAVLDYLKRNGVAAPEIAMDTIDTSRINKRNEAGNETNEIEFYDARQTFVMTSSNVQLIKDVSGNIAELIKDGIDISVCAPEFLVSDLKDTKVKLLAKATDDGYHRAMALAENSRAKVGALVSAEQGVLQITKRHSTDTSGGGAYDTSTIEKTVKAVVTMEYMIERKK
jgi:hypothetical protein